MASMNSGQRSGIPMLPDETSDERLFRARTIEAIKELYRRMNDAQRAINTLENQAGGQ